MSDNVHTQALVASLEHAESDPRTDAVLQAPAGAVVRFRDGSGSEMTLAGVTTRAWDTQLRREVACVRIAGYAITDLEYAARELEVVPVVSGLGVLSSGEVIL
jgi:hypothetical protein